ncbi:MAG: hypothetical protein IKU44_01115, partial [Firmicutes bacterium]|nr:hypothetical protein [Bacillota bacterium]
IKTIETREEVEQNILKRIAKKENGEWQLIGIPEYENAVAEELTVIEELGIDKDACKASVNARWGEFVLLLLTHQKYTAKEEGKNV